MPLNTDQPKKCSMISYFVFLNEMVNESIFKELIHVYDCKLDVLQKICCFCAYCICELIGCLHEN